MVVSVDKTHSHIPSFWESPDGKVYRLFEIFNNRYYSLGWTALEIGASSVFYNASWAGLRMNWQRAVKGLRPLRKGTRITLKV